MATEETDEDLPKLFSIFFTLAVVLLIGATLCFFGKDLKRKCCKKTAQTDPETSLA
jgi:hypothetical protein